MNSTLNSIQLSGIVKPGEIYVLKQGFELGEAEFLYTIRSDEEIVPALDMEENIVCKEFWTFQTFLGIEQVSEDAHLIKMLCYDKQKEEDIIVSYWLHRIKPFREELAKIKKQFNCE